MRQTLEEIILHLLRNSIDHGIENEEERLAAKKDEIPKIDFTIDEKDDFFHIDYCDDGRGLNLEKLAGIAKDNDVALDENASDLDIANTIFLQGVSSQKEVTDISGRGVGMYIIRDALRDKGGDIKIVFTGERSASGNRPFKFHIEVPVEISDTKKAAA